MLYSRPVDARAPYEEDTTMATATPQTHGRAVLLLRSASWIVAAVRVTGAVAAV